MRTKECPSLNQKQRLKARLFPISRLERPVQLCSDPDRQPNSFLSTQSLKEKGKSIGSLLCHICCKCCPISHRPVYWRTNSRVKLTPIHSTFRIAVASLRLCVGVTNEEEWARNARGVEAGSGGRGYLPPTTPTSPVLVVCGTPLREKVWGAALKSPRKVIYVILHSCQRKGGSGWKG